ncbi:helicase-exonuclease AddAB subunit AddA [Lederbergia galactosidilytica]|uniref:ATP-dependent helicase/nuclease subunit A n=1 Tax=Lederbergia galactosidilytica TaxID=217031 RepID=A0A177ZIF9_9BACI|nr:helicase-exonuclease AddAB subunit AddA [Lederbergia galactosidilytica]MBP1915700.1 ATP-dependent helicase/nuclease subunit A [Lederbergia galactosidilytica]OAK67751.1 ATP-dependent helicase [Lederbergia galactosidilytica]
MKTIIPIKPKSVTWTDDQWKAIMAKGQDILVAAAAGSGKTAVLVERIIEKIVSKDDPINVDQLLVVTFTNAAAAEMRHRIGEALEKAIELDPASTHLRRQLGLLNSASFSTLHSFCLNIVRSHYYLVDIDPGFRIADQTEADLLRDEVLDEVFEYEYGLEENESFFRLVDTFTNDRSDHALQELVFKLYDFSRSHPMPNQWLDQIVDMYDITDDQSIDELPFISALKFDVQLQLAAAKEMLQSAVEIAQLPGGPSPREDNYLDDLLIVKGMEEAYLQGWENLYEVMNQWKFSRAKPCKGEEFDPELIEEADQYRKQAKNMLEKLKKELFSRKPASFINDMKEMQGVLKSLIELVKIFAKQYSLKKTEKGLVDFADLEHLCLEILLNKESQVPAPSEIALIYRNQFKEVMVDEYQDVNLVQETILRLVTAAEENEGNLFMVGDVKQSIYRFRLAEPNLFLDKYLRFTPEGKDSGLRIDLSKNFRSRREVLDGVNFIFKQIMGSTVGEIEYSQDAELVKGSAYTESEADPFPVEIALVNRSDEGEDPATDDEDFNLVELEQSQLEARLIAQKIRKMVDERKPVYNLKSKDEKPIKYKDIVILVRSLGWAPDIIDECKNLGIPVYADLSTGYFEAIEVSIMLSLLKVIDNPDQDIPLAAVLRSPIIGLNEEELAHIRIQSRNKSYYQAMKQFITSLPDRKYAQAHQRVSEFFTQLQEWRSLAREGSLSQLIWQLYRDTDFYEFVGGLPGGKQRQANLRVLYDRASQYELTSFRGLFRFLRFIERMQERGNDLGVARTLGEEEDVVRIMTIHASKGLEFPVVFIGGIGKKFNMRDIQSSFLFDKEFGFASKYVNPEKRISYPSLPQIALRKKKKMELLAEEMRILYVAMTRAKEKLFLIGSVKNFEKEVKKWSNVGKVTEWLLPDHERAAATSYLDWVGRALVRHEQMIDGFHGEKSPQHLQHPSQWEIDIISPKTLANVGQDEEPRDEEWLTKVQVGEPLSINSSEKEMIYKRLQWQYPYMVATQKMSKQSVTELKRLFEMKDETSGTQLVTREQKLLYDRPKFMKEKNQLTPTEIGTAMHTVMQHINLSNPPTLQSIELLLDELVGKEILTLEQKDAIPSEQILHFFEHEIGKKLLTANKVDREVPFTLGIPAHTVYSDWNNQEEKILVQGIIDCVWKDENGIFLLDYKTDTIQGKFPGGFSQAKPILAKRYQVQLDLYEQALENIWGVPIKGKYLYFFDGGHLLTL